MDVPTVYTCFQPGCDLVFVDKGARNIHERAYHNMMGNQGDFICGLQGCARIFWQQNTRDNHEKEQHVHPKVFHCTDCESIFTTKRSRKEHMDYKHGPPRFVCAYCSKNLPRKSRLVAHKLKCPARPSSLIDSVPSTFPLSTLSNSTAPVTPPSELSMNGINTISPTGIVELSPSSSPKADVSAPPKKRQRRSLGSSSVSTSSSAALPSSVPFLLTADEVLQDGVMESFLEMGNADHRSLPTEMSRRCRSNPTAQTSTLTLVAAAGPSDVDQLVTAHTNYSSEYETTGLPFPIDFLDLSDNFPDAIPLEDTFYCLHGGNNVYYV